MQFEESRLKSFKDLKGIKWPHPKEWKTNPETLAKSGFYFDPEKEDVDNVTCYMCKKSLSGWTELDDPVVEHQSHSAQCALVVLAKGKSSSKTLEAARLKTFTGFWPHEEPSAKKMASAGFVYLPYKNEDNGDSAKCLSCGLELDGWERDDDPLHEHSKRSETCPHVVKGKKQSSKKTKKTSPINDNVDISIMKEDTIAVGDETTVMDPDISIVSTRSRITRATRANASVLFEEPLIAKPKKERTTKRKKAEPPVDEQQEAPEDFLKEEKVDILEAPVEIASATTLKAPKKTEKGRKKRKVETKKEDTKENVDENLKSEPQEELKQESVPEEIKQSLEQNEAPPTTIEEDDELKQFDNMTLEEILKLLHSKQIEKLGKYCDDELETFKLNFEHSMKELEAQILSVADN